MEAAVATRSQRFNHLFSGGGKNTKTKLDENELAGNDEVLQENHFAVLRKNC